MPKEAFRRLILQRFRKKIGLACERPLKALRRWSCVRAGFCCGGASAVA